MSKTLSAEDTACRWRLADKKGRTVEVPHPLAPLADTHGHLLPIRRSDPALALVRAALVGVRLLVVPVDPTDDVPDVGAFLAWWEEQRRSARNLLAEAAGEGFVVPEFLAVHASVADSVGSDSSAVTTFAAADNPTSMGSLSSAGNPVRTCGLAGIDDFPDLLDNLFFIAGAHPYGAQRLLEDASARVRLAKLLDDPRCIGVGEIGLDFGPYSELPAEVQEEAFRLQLRLAHERHLPVELHLRDGADDTRAHDLAERVLREEGVPEAGCDLHCFTSGPDVMAPFVEMGCYIAFGGAATFKRSDDIRAAATQCPSNLILSETDCPFMTPVPLRGQECEPALVGFTAQCLAEVRAEASIASPTETYRCLWDNACSFFGLEFTK